MKKLLFFFLVSSSLIGNPLIIKEDLIPTPLNPKCFDSYASSLLELDDGTIIAVWDGTSGMNRCSCDAENEGIWISRYELDWDDQGSWTKPEEVAWVQKNKCWNPVLCKTLCGEILLFFQVGLDPRRMYTALKRSSDGGKTWSEIETLPQGFRGPVKNKPLLTQDGVLICGASSENGATIDAFKATSAWIEISKDGGLTFEKSWAFELPNRKFGIVEPTLFHLNDCTLMALFRDRGTRVGIDGFIWQTFSYDLGKTWTPLKKTNLPNPDTSLDGIIQSDGKIVIVYNNSHVASKPLSLAVSSDNGQSFKKIGDIETQVAEMPAIIQTSKGQIHLLYSTENPKLKRRSIKHVILNSDCIN